MTVLAGGELEIRVGYNLMSMMGGLRWLWRNIGLHYSQSYNDGSHFFIIWLWTLGPSEHSEMFKHIERMDEKERCVEVYKEKKKG